MAWHHLLRTKTTMKREEKKRLSRLRQLLITVSSKLNATVYWRSRPYWLPPCTDARNNGLFSYVSIGYHCYYIHKISLKAEYTEPFICVSQSCWCKHQHYFMCECALYFASVWGVAFIIITSIPAIISDIQFFPGSTVCLVISLCYSQATGFLFKRYSIYSEILYSSLVFG